MAQTGFTPLKIYASSTAGATPSASKLINDTSGSELGINITDGKLFYKDNTGVVQVIATKASVVNVASFSGGTTGLTPNTATTGVVTLGGTLAVANGGTGVTTSTGSGSTVLSASPALTGTPTAPTATAGTNTTQLATTAFATAAVASAFPTGTRLVFAQAAPPTGWTQDTSDAANNRMMRVVNSTGGGTGGSASPILNNVVPSHTHEWSANTNTVDINHYHDGTTGGQSTGHVHTGTTDGMNANNPHAHGPLDGGLFATYIGGGQGPGFTGSGGRLNNPTASTDINHGHTFTTAGNNVDHNHSFGTGYMSGNNTHYHSVSGTTDNGSSQTNWAPRYNDVVIGTKA